MGKHLKVLPMTSSDFLLRITIILAITVAYGHCKTHVQSRFHYDAPIAQHWPLLQRAEHFSNLFPSSKLPVKRTKWTKQFAEARQHNKKEKKPHGQEIKTSTKDVDSTLDDLLEVMGPHLFLIPFVLKALPFAIPAIPISYILTRHAPATIPELFMQLMEFSTQISELTMGHNETNGGIQEG